MLSNKQTEDEKKEENDNKSVMVLWDFDWSLINGNSDFYVMRKLFGEKEYDYDIYPKLRQEANAVDITVFTDIMDKFAWPKLFNDFKLDKNSFAKHLIEIPIFDENLHVINTLGNDKYKDMTTQYVISDANTILIETILEHHKLLKPNIISSDRIYTNPGWYDEKTGIIRCKRYHTKENPHNCPLKDSLNICKGKILDEEIMKDKVNVNNMIRVYIGDGSGDYCPITKLNQNDYAFVRKFPKLRGLEKKIEKDDGIQLKCTVLKWKDGKELLDCFKKALPFIKF